MSEQRREPVNLAFARATGHVLQREFQWTEGAILLNLADDCEHQRREIERLTRELTEAKSALRERIESEPLRYAMLTQQFRAVVEGGAAMADEREFLIAERDRLRAALEEIANHRRVFATYDRLQHIAEQALSGVPAEAPTDQDASSICSVCGAPATCEHSFAERVAGEEMEETP